MTPTDIGILSRQIDDLKQAVAEHADMDSRQHQAVSLQIADNAQISRADRAAIATQLEPMTEVLEFVKAAKGFVKFMTWAGVFVKWVGGIALALGAVLALIRFGKTP